MRLRVTNLIHSCCPCHTNRLLNCKHTYRREALRFRRAMEEAQEKLGAATEDNARLREQLEDASSELAAVEAFANKRCVGFVHGDVVCVVCTCRSSTC